MRVQDLRNVVSNVDPRLTQKTPQNGQRTGGAESKTVDGDSLDLSLSARISSASVTELPQVPEETSVLTPERVQTIQDRLKSGFYDQKATAEETADRILNYYSR
jgi:hypothetical protein